MISVIHIVTPCLNTRDTIDRTIISVVTQAGDFRIRYHVKDGGSTDGTVERLEWWAQRLRSKDFPIQCEGLEFSYSSEPDAGMYDAIIQGHAHMSIGNNEFMTWINADDILVPGALSFVAAVDQQFEANQVSWLGGAAAIRQGDMMVVSYDRIIPTEVVRAGMCDGIHWDFVQQEGTFYRKWLWDSIEPAKSIRTMKVGGDWNAWRLMSRCANLIQAPFPLGVFTKRAGQLSQKFRDTYHREMDELVPAAERREMLKTLAIRGNVVRRIMKVLDTSTGRLGVFTEKRDQTVAHFYHRVFSESARAGLHNGEPQLLFEGALQPSVIGALQPSVSNDASDLMSNPKTCTGIIAFDADWQFPAITEQHAYHRMREHCRIPENVVYVAYPWATLIDKLQSRAKDARLHFERFRKFCDLLPKDKILVTVCQQIYMRKYLYLFEQAGISHIFWSHATQQDAENAKSGAAAPAIHPFPLYPVQVTEPRDGFHRDADGRERPLLFSFIGARANQYNPTQTRNWIIDDLSNDSRGLVIGRDGWHYEKLVYDLQVHNRAKDISALLDMDAAEQFKASLDKSIFSLCPAGTGPNSIRLWESLGAGAIPVILADNWAPPGNRKLWDAAAIFCRETIEDVRALPDRLAAIASDPALLASKRQAMRQLWMLYGPDSFVYDIITLLPGLSRPAHGKPAASLAPRPVASPPPVRAGSTPASHKLLLRKTAGVLLLDRTRADQILDPSNPLAAQIAEARASMPEDDATRAHFEKVVAHVSGNAALTSAPRNTHVQRDTPLPKPNIARCRTPRVHLFGKHSNRTPLSYGPIIETIHDKLDLVGTHAAADIIVTGFNRDYIENAATIAEWKKARPDLKLAILSEEPLWDIHWSGGFTERTRELKLPDGVATYTFINHENSQVFDFSNYPYFPLTTHEFPATYATGMAKFSRLTPKALLEHWRKAPVHSAFFAENRTGAQFRREFPENDILGLCEFRTSVAQLVRDSKSGVLCVGKGWHDQSRRQDLPDWHLDKLSTLSGRTFICSAIENTHHRHYISEKVFDPFAVGAIPVYHASPRHRVFEFVPAECMINTYGKTPEEAARIIAGFEPDLAFAEAWLKTANDLRARFANLPLVAEERRRIATECLREIEALV